MSEHPIITLCGSRRFRKLFEEVSEKLTLQGYIVLSLHVWNHNIGQLDVLNDIQEKKIEMADIIGIICPNNYIGESTSKELKYAKKLAKVILFFKEDGEGY